VLRLFNERKGNDKMSELNNKYLEEKFENIVKSIAGLEQLIKSSHETNSRQYEMILTHINRLEKSDALMDKDVKDVKHQLKQIKSQTDKNNFFSIKGVIFVVSIFVGLMAVFLLNGVELLNKAL